MGPMTTIERPEPKLNAYYDSSTFIRKEQMTYFKVLEKTEKEVLLQYFGLRKGGLIRKKHGYLRIRKDKRFYLREWPGDSLVGKEREIFMIGNNHFFKRVYLWFKSFFRDPKNHMQLVFLYD